ncbi:MAG TPA: hypothetical protein VKV05_08065 [Terriglobales bacterium]|nr:hypothetical protein [Terriglobales bacterium]
MRRVLASLLLVLLLAGDALPLLPGQSSLPPCCRRGGKHHCMMLHRLASDGLHAAVPNCPYRHLAALIFHSVTGLKASPRRLSLTQQSQEVIRAASPDVVRYVADPTPQRAPPLA